MSHFSNDGMLWVLQKKLTFYFERGCWCLSWWTMAKLLSSDLTQPRGFPSQTPDHLILSDMLHQEDRRHTWRKTGKEKVRSILCCFVRAKKNERCWICDLTIRSTSHSHQNPAYFISPQLELGLTIGGSFCRSCRTDHHTSHSTHPYFICTSSNWQFDSHMGFPLPPLQPKCFYIINLQ